MVGDATSLVFGVSYVLVWILVVIQSFALLEVLKQIGQVRQRLDLDDRPIPVGIGQTAGTEFTHRVGPLEAGVQTAVLVFLSDDCSTCRTVAAGLAEIIETAEPGVQVVPIVHGRDRQSAEAFMLDANLRREWGIVDEDDEIAISLGLNLRPVALVVLDGIVTDAAMVRSPSQVEQVVERVGGSRRPDERDVSTREAEAFVT